MKTFYNGSASIVIDGDTFPIVGAELSDQLHAKIIQERQHIYDYLPNITTRIQVDYDRLHSDSDELQPNKIDVAEIRLSRSGSQIIFSAIGHLNGLSQQGDEPVQDGELTVLAKSALPIGTLMRIANYYISHQSADQDLISDLTAAGSLNGMEKSQTETSYFHNEISFAIVKCLANQPVRSSDIRALKYIATALLLHVMPARIYQSQSFISGCVEHYFPEIHALPRSASGRGQASDHTP